MEMRNYIRLILQWYWLIILGVVVTGTTAFLYSKSQQPVYKATSELLVSAGDAENLNDISALNSYNLLAQSYAERLKNYEVLSIAAQNIGINENIDKLSENIRVSNVNNTQLIQLTVEHTDPTVARDLANEIPHVFAERNNLQQVSRYADSKSSLEAELADLDAELEMIQKAISTENSKVSPDLNTVEQLRNNELLLRDTHSKILQSYEEVRMAEARTLDNLIIDEPARQPTTPIRPRVLQNTLLGIIVGGMLAIGIVFLIDYLDDSVNTPEEIEEITGVSTLGGVMQLDITNPNETLVMTSAPRSPAAEAFRQIRTNLKFSTIRSELKSVVVTSANASEGKSTVAANLAITLAQTGKSVILVDSDLRRPNQHKIFQCSSNVGLTNLIVDGKNDLTLIQGTDIKGLQIVPSGPLPPNPAELLGSERMSDIVTWLESEAEFVIYDMPPVLAVTDASIMARLVSTTLFVVRAGKTTGQTLRNGVEQILAVEGRIAGIVLNGVGRKSGYYYYYYDQSYYVPESVSSSKQGWRNRLKLSRRLGLSGLSNLFS